MASSSQIRQRMLLAGFLASSIALFPIVGPSGQQTESSQVASSAGAATRLPSVGRTVSSERAAMMYRKLWGIDDITLRATASGAVIRFSYRVVDRDKAKALNDKKNDPYLLVQRNGARLEVPATEKVGKLRQTATPENGREYWMVFVNSSHAVQPGDRVDIVIGTFRANGLTVETPQAPVLGKR